MTVILLFFATTGNTKPIVVASIKPLQLLVAAVADDLVESQLLLPPTSSPHLYHMRPSDRRRLEFADLVVWVGPSLERFLVKPLSLLPANHVIELADNKTSPQPPSESHHGGSHNHQLGADPHIWLDPDSAVSMARLIATRLSEIDPVNKERYQYNWLQFQQRVALVDQQIKQDIQLISGRRYIVLHDGYNHFEQRYGIKHTAALTVSPEQKPSVKHLLNIHRTMESQGVHCLFREPQHQLTLRAMFEQQEGLALGILDPLASEIPVSSRGYEEFLLSFADGFKGCLTQ